MKIKPAERRLPLKTSDASSLLEHTAKRDTSIPAALCALFLSRPRLIALISDLIALTSDLIADPISCLSSLSMISDAISDLIALISDPAGVVHLCL